MTQGWFLLLTTLIWKHLNKIKLILQMKQWRNWKVFNVLTVRELERESGLEARFSNPASDSFVLSTQPSTAKTPSKHQYMWLFTCRCYIFLSHCFHRVTILIDDWENCSYTIWCNFSNKNLVNLITMVKKLPYFLDYKTHIFPPNVGGKCSWPGWLGEGWQWSGVTGGRSRVPAAGSLMVQCV